MLISAYKLSQYLFEIDSPCFYQEFVGNIAVGFHHSLSGVSRIAYSSLVQSNFMGTSFIIFYRAAVSNPLQVPAVSNLLQVPVESKT